MVPVLFGTEWRYVVPMHNPNDMLRRFSLIPRQQPMDFNHWGPRTVHLSKVPDGQDVTTYDGSGEWTKIDTVGVEVKNNVMNWKLYVGITNYHLASVLSPLYQHSNS
jgi:hypothetical protein